MADRDGHRLFRRHGAWGPFSASVALFRLRFPDVPDGPRLVWMADRVLGGAHFRRHTVLHRHRLHRIARRAADFLLAADALHPLESASGKKHPLVVFFGTGARRGYAFEIPGRGPGPVVSSLPLFFAPAPFLAPTAAALDGGVRGRAGLQPRYRLERPARLGILPFSIHAHDGSGIPQADSPHFGI